MGWKLGNVFYSNILTLVGWRWVVFNRLKHYLIEFICRDTPDTPAIYLHGLFKHLENPLFINGRYKNDGHILERGNFFLDLR